MFNCEVCGKVSNSGDRCTLIVTKRRVHLHPFRYYGNLVKREEGRLEWTPDEGGRGTQIVKEIKACLRCSSYDPRASDPAEIAITKELRNRSTAA